MDHSHHDHSMHHMDMDMGHGGMGGNDHCSMNMLFTWDTRNLCIIFKSWHVRGPISLVLTLIAIVALTAGYELVREMSRRYELRLEARRSGTRRETSNGSAKDGQLMKALFYSVQVFYSFFIMLLFMTYNGWVMLAVAVGAFVGYLVWGNSTATKTVACH